MVRGKFNISKIELAPGNMGGAVTLQAVSRGDRNSSWAAATPSGSITMQINNPKALDWFMQRLMAQRESGRYPEVFVDFADATDGWPGDGHAFRAGAGSDGTIYGPNNCGECGFTKDATYDGKPAHPNG